MIEAWSTADVYAAESALMAELASSGAGEGELMARAVEGLIEVTLTRVEQLGARRVVALVGTGNNGADALYAVAGLAAAGLSCAAVHLAGRVHPGALAAAEEAGVVLVAVSADEVGTHSAEPVAEVIAEADLVLDGILGIGGHGGLPPWAARLVAAVPDTAYVIAVDLPSGQDPNGGSLDPDGVFADETVTFSVLKPAHLLPPTEVACGQLTVVDIGLELATPAAVRRFTRDDVASAWPCPRAGDDKYSRGVVGIIAGSENYTGAAVLAVSAAVEAGAGMARFVGTPTAEALVRSAAPEAVHGVGQVQAWVIGPGLDVADERSAEQVRAARDALASEEPVLLDAGGLDLIEPGWRRPQPTLLTPHAGECARLLTRLTDQEVARDEVEAAPVTAAQRLADVTGCTVLLKGATTVIAAPDGRLFSQCDAPPWLATAGAGDVLAGLLGVIMASSLTPADSGALGALVHGVAADRANPGGPVRAMAVAQAMPGTIAHLLTL